MFRGSPDDVSVSASVLRDPDGRCAASWSTARSTSSRASAILIATAGPDPGAGAGRVELSRLCRRPARLLARRGLGRSSAPARWCRSISTPAWRIPPARCRCSIVAPGPRESIEDVATTRTRLLATIYRNVAGQRRRLPLRGGAWFARAIAAAQHASVHLVAGERPRRPGLCRCRRLSDPEHAVSRRCRRRHGRAGQVAAAALRRLRACRRAVRGDLARRHRGALFRRAPESAARSTARRRRCSTAMAGSRCR